MPQPLSEIGQLPVVTKAELMSHFNDWVTDPSVTRAQIDAFLADPGNVGRDFLGRYVVCTTSGATGIPAILLAGVADWRLSSPVDISWATR